MFLYEVNIDLVNAERGRKHRDTGEWCFSGGSSMGAFNSRPDESANRKMREMKKGKNHIVIKRC